jgi:hypothetical protein
VQRVGSMEILQQRQRLVEAPVGFNVGDTSAAAEDKPHNGEDDGEHDNENTDDDADDSPCGQLGFGLRRRRRARPKATACLILRSCKIEVGDKKKGEHDRESH